MPDEILWEPLTAENLGLFSDFYCGDEPWERAVSDWISGRSADCAAQDIRDRRSKVFLYRNQVRKVIGFGAVAKMNGSWPNNSDPRIKVAIVPWLGLYKQFHGLPKDPPRYSDQLLADLVHKAKLTACPFLVLFVHPNNTPAIRLYTRSGFEFSDKIAADGEHKAMWFDLRSA